MKQTVKEYNQTAEKHQIDVGPSKKSNKVDPLQHRQILDRACRFSYVPPNNKAKEGGKRLH